MTHLSVLDLVPITAGSSPEAALRNGLDLARHAEHHNIEGIASAATAVVISHVAAGTREIRVGAGGIMLPNHAPLIIAEQFGTLARLYPGRIDLGLGRAPGTDHQTIKALRRDPAMAERFPQDVLELQAFLAPVQPGQSVQAVPAAGTEVPLWILGSSLYGAELAGILGLPFAFASHFAPDALFDALSVYRKGFRPSAQLDKPYVMPGIAIYAAETDEQAKYLFTSIQQGMVRMLRGGRGLLQPPIDDMDSFWNPREKLQASHMLTYSIVGGPETIRAGLREFIDRTQADELMVNAMVYDHTARLRSFEIAAEIMRDIHQGR